MSKTIIEVKCFDQVLTFVNTPVIAGGGIGEDYVSFEFCEKWDGYTISALFWRRGVDPVPKLLDAENTCQVPPELMLSKGIVYFGACGVNPDGERRTSQVLSYRIEEGVITENTALPMPEEDVYTELLAQYADIKMYAAANIEAAATSAANAEAAANSAKAAADSAKESYFPRYVTSTLTDGVLYLDLPYRPADRATLTFAAQAAASEVTFVTARYNATDGTGEVEEVFELLTSYNTVLDGEAFEKWDYVTVVLIRVTGLTGFAGRAYVQNPQITYTVREKLTAAQEYVDGIACNRGNFNFDSYYTGSAATGYRLGIFLSKEPVDGSILRFKAAAASEDIVGLLISVRNGTLTTDENYALVDADGSTACNGVHSFSKGAWVTVLLDYTENKAHILNAVPDALEPWEVYFSGYYTGTGTSDRQIDFGVEPNLLVIQGKDSKNYTKDFMMLVNPDGLSSMDIEKGFQFMDLHTSAQDCGGAAATLSGSVLTLMGGTDVVGFNMSGRTYYYWGLKKSW